MESPSPPAIEGIVHITPRPRRQSIDRIEHYSGILGSSVVCPPPASDPTDVYQSIPLATNNLSEDGTYIIPESSQTVLEEQKNALLKRRSSWRRFKDKVSGWMGVDSPSTNNYNESESLIQSTSESVNHRLNSPSLHINIPRNEDFVVEDAEALLKSTNCYSSGKRVTPQSPSPLLATSPEIPKIIVTSDRFRSESNEQEEEVRKSLAVAKIKEAITSMNSNEDISLHDPSPRTPSSQRRHSSVLIDDSRRSRKNSDYDISERRGSGPNLRRTHSARLVNKARPMIWEHFDVVPGNTSIGKCKECHMAVSCKYNTGQFVRHLQNSHKEVYRGYQSKMDSAWAKSVIEKNLK